MLYNLSRMAIQEDRVEEVTSKPLKRSRQRGPKPILASTSSRKGQETESKAFVMSSLRRILGYFWECKNLTVCCTNMKLSWIKRPLMKAVWLGETITLRRHANLLARIFVTSLAKL